MSVRGVFGHLEPYAGDPILSLNEAYGNDPRPHKINLSIGIYFDDAGHIPVLGCVREAEAALLAEGAAKPYLPIEGAPACRRAASGRSTRSSGAPVQAAKEEAPPGTARS